jgi:1,2-phenylacetyl-CoA epoxidase catalytic subunit
MQVRQGLKNSRIPANPFVEKLQEYVNDKLASLDLLKDAEVELTADKPEVVRRLKLALKNELEAAELAAHWIPSTPEVEVKLALARQAGDEARHYHLIQDHLEGLGVDLNGFNPAADGYGPMFNLLQGLNSTIERVAGAHFTREALALKKNEQFMAFCERAGLAETAELYRNQIQPDEGWHVDLGHRVLTRYAISTDDQEKARRAVEAVLDLAVKVQRKQFQEMKLSHAPGC